MLVADILRRKGEMVVTADVTDSIAHAVQLMTEHGVGCIVVTSTGPASFDGLLAERDVVRLLAIEGQRALGMNIADACRRDVAATAPSASVEEVMSIMTERRQRHVPVVRPDRSLCGLVSIGDVVSLRLAELELERSALTNYITGTR